MGYELAKPVQVSALAKALGLLCRGEDIEIQSIAPLNNLCDKALSFCSKDILLSHGAAVIMLDTLCSEPRKCTLIESSNPRLDFIRALSWLKENIGFNHNRFPSKISSSITVGQNVVIEDGCIIEDNVILEHNVVIHSGTRIGKNSRIRANSCIGGDGFGFERMADGTPLRFEHLGGVNIGKNVEIGALNSIARSSLGDTIIEDNVKTDNLVHIAHNCHIKSGAFLTACTELSGGVTVGKNAWLGPNSSVIQKVTIGDNTLIGIGAVVTKDIPDQKIFAGNPAREFKQR